VIRRVIDTATGEAEIVALPCCSTRERVCKPCATKARRLRMDQCRAGWHRTDDPAGQDDGPEPDPDDPDDSAGSDTSAPVRRRSTRRLPQFPPLPVVPMEHRTVGRELASPNGKVYRPSMFLTLTLPSYGRVHKDGTPCDPESYDYRRVALDSIHFAGRTCAAAPDTRSSTSPPSNHNAASPSTPMPPSEA